MRLTELDPRWLVDDADRVGFVFRCPHCRQTWLSCMFRPTRIVGADEDHHDSQFRLFAAAIPGVSQHEVVPCAPQARWICTPASRACTFDIMTIKPSLDASASGHWHGWITAGEVS